MAARRARGWTAGHFHDLRRRTTAPFGCGTRARSERLNGFQRPTRGAMLLIRYPTPEDSGSLNASFCAGSRRGSSSMTWPTGSVGHVRTPRPSRPRSRWRPDRVHRVTGL